MREWTERHIRELIRNEIMRIEGSGSGDKPPLPYNEYWPGPVDLVTGGKHVLFSACLTEQAGAIWPSCWIEFLGIDYIREGTTDTGRSLHVRKSLLYNGVRAMIYIRYGLSNTIYGDGDKGISWRQVL